MQAVSVRLDTDYGITTSDSSFRVSLENVIAIMHSKFLYGDFTSHLYLIFYYYFSYTSLYF